MLEDGATTNSLPQELGHSMMVGCGQCGAGVPVTLGDVTRPLGTS